ncbi:hypothetical protein HBI56_160850 [Parastagonospora nodorum]|uniref:Uncharacterized protein n=1 Tax=Phaeosphaeria nodorum (strain SN15 / ATCC MYA-4574 / FGSC 10173) TaxID=321614 RepID=A0A7U2NPV9_PHANO|nr:hypothetical protein HBH56_211860 [Parastagonospora nodorum]QRD06028.1 hypothetical protein JI435_134480 [Parastagonospora nodorum SN15]KAH3931235.1 hypothetical protein HBH54_100470 [Parastagonospora nodorum]KAH3944250.1 hypothetical protein HBH53_161940 [Parastagonospora nodorum]KAH3960738.1 hypothetical protein HBH51_190150 [Parastagonospora nodorum]
MSSSHTVFSQGKSRTSSAILPRPWVPKRPGGPQTLPRFFTYPPMKAKWSYTRIQWPRRTPPCKPSVTPLGLEGTTPARRKRDILPKLSSKKCEPARRSARIQREQDKKEEDRSRKERTDAEAEEATMQTQKIGRPANEILKLRTKKACLGNSRSEIKGAIKPLRRGEFGKVSGSEGGDYMQHQKKLTLQARAELTELYETDMVFDDETDAEEG